MTPFDRFILAIIEEGYLWSLPMVEAYREHKPNSAIKLKEQWVCPYCWTDKESPSGTGLEMECCGAVGHAERTMILEESNGNE